MEERQKKRFIPMRNLVQIFWFALSNGYAYGFVSGRIYTGKSKQLCVPGLNCYSCPGALGSCPIGAIQATADSGQYHVPFYAIGFLMLFGSIFGRFICGWLCPFGMVQDFLYKIPTFRKIKNLPGHQILKWLKYIVLVLLVFVFPDIVTDGFGTGRPWFCEYACPSGTLFAGIPLILLRDDLRQMAGALFGWKSAVLVVIVIASIKAYRPFCKYLCPLGASYSLFQPISAVHYSVDVDKCVRCGKCEDACKMGINPIQSPNDLECIRCGDCIQLCPTHCIETQYPLKNRFQKEIAR